VERGQVIVFDPWVATIVICAWLLISIRVKNKLQTLAVIFIIVAPFTEEFVFPVSSKALTLGHIFGFLSIIYAAYYVVIGKLKFRAHQLSLIVGLLFVVSALSLLGNVSLPITNSDTNSSLTPTTRGAIELVRLVFTILVGASIVLVAINNRPRTTLLTTAFASAGFVHAAIAVLMIVPALTGVLGYSFDAGAVVATTFEYFWPDRVNTFRVTGFMEEPKNFGFFIATTCLTTIYLARQGKKYILRWVPIKLAIGVQIVALTTTVSQAAVSAIVFAIFLTIIASITHIKNHKLGSEIKAQAFNIGWGVTLVIVTLSGMSMTASDPGKFWDGQLDKSTSAIQVVLCPLSLSCTRTSDTNTGDDIVRSSTPTAVTEPTPVPTTVTEPTPVPTTITEPTPVPTAVTEPTPVPTAATEPTPVPTAVTEPTPVPTVIELDVTGARRADRYRADISAFTTYPILGVGYGRYPYYFENFTPEGSAAKGFSGNQSYLTGVGANTGVLGILIIFGFLFTIYSRIVRSSAETTDTWASIYITAMFWLIIGILLSHDESLKMYLLVPISIIIASTLLKDQTITSTEQ
jgi:hypothetical protein